MFQTSVKSSPDFKGRQVTLNLIFLLKIQILASFSYQAFILTHFPITLRKKFRFIGTLREDSFIDLVWRDVSGTFREWRFLLLDVSVEMEIIDFLQPRIKQNETEKYIIITPENA